MDFGFARGGTAPAASRGSISKREAASRLGLQSRGTGGVQVSLVFDLGTSAAAAGRSSVTDKRKQQHPHPAQKQGRVRAAGFWRGSDAPPAPSVRAKDQPRAAAAAQSSQRSKALSAQRAVGQRRQSASTRRSSDAHDMAHYEFEGLAGGGRDGDSNNSDDDGQSLMTQEHRSALQNRRLGKSVGARSSAAAAGRYSVSSSPVLLTSASESGLHSNSSSMRSPSHGHDTGLALPQQQSRAKGGIIDIMADLPTERERAVSGATVDIDDDDADSGSSTHRSSSSAAAAAAVPAAAQYNNSSSSSVWTAMKTSLLSSLGQAQHHNSSSKGTTNAGVTRPPLVPVVQEPEPALLLSARGRAVAALSGSEHAATSSRNGLDLQQLDYERSTMDRTGRLGRVASARLLRTDNSTNSTTAAAAAGEYSGSRGKLCTAAPRHTKSAGVTRRTSDVVLQLQGTRAELVPRDTPCDSSSTAGGSSTHGTGTTNTTATATATAAAAASASAALQRRRSAVGSRGSSSTSGAAAGGDLFSTAASTAYDGPPVAAAALTWMTDAEGIANFSRRPPSRQREAFPTHLASEAPFSISGSGGSSTQQQQQQRQQQQSQQQQPRRDAFLSAAAASAELHASQSQQRQQQQAAFAHAAVTIGTAAALSVRDSSGAAGHSTRAHLFDAATARKSSASAAGTDAAGRPRARHKPPEQSLFLETPAELPLALAAAAAAKAAAAVVVSNNGSSSNSSSSSSSSAKPLSVVTTSTSVVPPLALSSTAIGASPHHHHLALLVEDDLAVTAVGSPAASRTAAAASAAAAAAAAAATALMTPSHDFSLDTRHDDPARDGFDLLEVSRLLCMRANKLYCFAYRHAAHCCCCWFTAKLDLALIVVDLLLRCLQR
jgi:hypothetical protein